jgi:hypothetical protein
MQKKILPYIEDYIEILAGYVGLKGKNMSFSLARYDVQILGSLAEQTNRGVGYTDKQALLAHKLVVKYKRQFAKYDIDIGFHEDNGHYRIPVRSVDRSRSIKLVGNQIQLRFPYDSKMIDDIKESGKNVHGQIRFDREQRVWLLSITEPRLKWIDGLVNKYQFDIEESVSALIKSVNAEEEKTYQIVLERVNGQLQIRNAEQTLNDYIVDSLGGFGDDNLLKLVDQSSILGYEVSDEISAELDQTNNTNQNMLLKKREVHIPLDDGLGIADIINYANLTDRWPIYVLENVDVNVGKIIHFLRSYFSKEELLEVGAKQRKLDINGKRCIYLNNWQTSWSDRIPLLITMTSLMIGPKKQHLKQQSDKVVYCTDVVIKYASNNNTI